MRIRESLRTLLSLLTLPYRRFKELRSAEARAELLLSRFNKVVEEYQTLNIHKASLEVRNAELEKDKARLSKEVAALVGKNAELTKTFDKYNLLDFPQIDAKEAEARMKAWNQFTLGVIADYLRLDRFELVKNLAKVTDSANASTVIAYRDGALSRIEALISVLDKCRKETSFKDRMEGEIKSK